MSRSKHTFLAEAENDDTASCFSPYTINKCSFFSLFSASFSHFSAFLLVISLSSVPKHKKAVIGTEDIFWIFIDKIHIHGSHG